MTSHAHPSRCAIDHIAKLMLENPRRVDMMGYGMIVGKQTGDFDEILSCVWQADTENSLGECTKNTLESWAMTCASRNWPEGLLLLINTTKDLVFFRGIWKDETVVPGPLPAPLRDACAEGSLACIKILLNQTPNPAHHIDALIKSMESRKKESALFLWDYLLSSGSLAKVMASTSKKDKKRISHLVIASTHLPDDDLLSCITKMVNPITVLAPLGGAGLSRVSLDSGHLALSPQTLAYWDRIFSRVTEGQIKEEPDHYAELAAFFEHPTISTHTPLSKAKQLRSVLLNGLDLCDKQSGRQAKM